MPSERLMVFWDDDWESLWSTFDGGGAVVQPPPDYIVRARRRGRR